MQLDKISVEGYENVVRAEDLKTGLKAIIAVHNTNLGPAVGGTRMYNYESEDDALKDVLRLSRGMTYKSALAGVDFGGGKSVIIADTCNKSPELLTEFAQAVNSLNGTYICAEDMNTTTADMNIISKTTTHVLGRTGGAPSPITALGVFSCIEKMASEILNIPMTKLHVAVQGVGRVGECLVEMLTNAGARTTIADINNKKVKELHDKYGCVIGDTNTIHATECDIYAPCAFGGTLNSTSIPELNCKAVIGAANNQLDTNADADALQKRGIYYAPDYLVNAGGIINVFYECQEGGYDAEKARASVIAIGDTMMEIFTLAKEQGITPSKAADKVAEGRFGKQK